MGFNRLFTACATTSALSLLIITACSDDNKDSNPSRGGQDSGVTAGNAGQPAAFGGASGHTSAAGGKIGNGGAQVAGTAGVAQGLAGAGTAGASSLPASGTLDDLIGAICDWELKCCDAGEIRWQLGPVTASAAACKEKFVYLLRNDTAASSPYPSFNSTPAGNSPAINGLLIRLGYKLDMTKVDENPAGIGACIAQWRNKECTPVAAPTTARTHCSAATVNQTDPCDLTNLVKPKLNAGEICSFDLTQSASNDVECKAGTTCLSQTDPDNPNKSYPTCVTRGTANAPCTFEKDCDFGYYCSAGRCVEKGGAGATCAFKTPNAPKPDALAVPCKPGFTCNPITLTCVADCSAESVCNQRAQDGGDDYACPTGTSCMPVAVGSDNSSFKLCKAIGSGACNSLQDCPAGQYCAANACTAQKAVGTECSTAVEGSCAAGTYCAAGTTPGTGICTAYTALGNDCNQAAISIANPGCDPSTTIGCVFYWDDKRTEIRHVCSNRLLNNGDRCGADLDCSSGRCEFAGVNPTFKTCIAGAASGEPCDTGTTPAELTSVDGKTRCGPGLTCDPVESKCVPQVGPGQSCINKAGVADQTLCTNSSCDTTQWTPIDASYIMCTDTAVTPFNGGTGAVCDGK